jgi:hypothetical protein
MRDGLARARYVHGKPMNHDFCIQRITAIILMLRRGGVEIDGGYLF